MKFSLSFLLVVFIFINSSCQWVSSKFSKTTTQVVFDAEMDLDDLCSLYLLARNYKDKLACVTISGTERYRFDNAPESAASILTLAQRTAIPVSELFTSSFCEAASIPDTWEAPVESLSSTKLPEAAIKPLDMTAPDLLLKIVHTSREKLTILCLGPLNNIAHAITEHPTIREKIERIIILGGSLHGTESITVPSTDRWKQYSDYNFFVDPCAANIVFTSQIPITLVPLDVTSLIPINPTILDKYAPDPKTEGAKFVIDVLKDASKESLQMTGIAPLWDMVAAATIFDPSILRLEKASLKVVMEPGDHFGEVVEATDGALIDVCSSVDTEKFYSYYFNLINR